MTSNGDEPMTPFRETWRAALYLWDYFRIANGPAPGEEQTWQRIEAAARRIYESEDFLYGTHAPAVRARHARRIRRACREIARRAPGLISLPEPWIAEAVSFFEILAELAIDEQRCIRAAPR